MKDCCNTGDAKPRSKWKIWAYRIVWIAIVLLLIVVGLIERFKP